MILGVLLYGKAAMLSALGTFTTVAVIVGIAALLLWAAWAILGWIFGLVVATVTIIGWGLRQLGSDVAFLLWSNKAKARRTVIFLGLAAVSIASFRFFYGLL
jgi:hypothetical protein